jgi:hypothetical protein
MDWFLIVTGVLLMVWPVQYRWSMGRIRDRVAARGGDAAEFERRMDRPSFRAALAIAPIAGLVLVVTGLLG